MTPTPGADGWPWSDSSENADIAVVGLDIDSPGPPTRESPVLSCRIAVLATTLFAAALPAQTRTIRTISGEGAKLALAAAEAEARKNNWEMSFAVVDPAGELIAFHRMDGAGVATIQNASGKAKTAARFRRPTQAYDSMVSGGRPSLLNFENMTPIEGGVPVVVGGVVVGAIGVSGGTSPQDAVVARAAAAAVKP